AIVARQDNHHKTLQTERLQANRGWRGFILRLIGVNLPDKRAGFTQRLLLTRKVSGSVMKM
ncbi:hypothetical protein GFB08_24985, partial [Escherichia coli]|nr:hypothetical protein [Escherichia coli]